MKNVMNWLSCLAAVFLLVISGCGDDITNNQIADESVPSAPQSLQARSADGQITLEWEEVDGATSYNIYWGTEPGVDDSSNKLTTNYFPYIHSGLSRSTTYYYRISAVNGEGESPLSSEIPAQARLLFSRMLESLFPSDISANDYLGSAVSISGDYAIVGDFGDDYMASNTGSAYIFHRTGPESWDSGTRIVSLNPAAQDYFGETVAISGDYAVVGCANKDENGANSGAVYVYHRTGVNAWASVTKITQPTPQAYDMFGVSVSISGDYILVGATGKDEGIGTAFVFRRTGANEWADVTELSPSDAEEDYSIGFAVSISGDYALVTSVSEDVSSTYPGAAYIFHRTDTNTWDAGTRIVAPDAMAGEKFGLSASIDGDYVMVGDYTKAGGEGEALPGAGAVFIFHRTGTNTWDQGVKLTAPDKDTSDYFGFSVSIRGNYALVGAPFEDNGSETPLNSAGAAYVFQRTGLNTWDSGKRISCPNAIGSEQFGYSVALGGNGFALIGAANDSGGGASAGKAYIY